LAAALAEFSDRSEGWWQVYRSDPQLASAWSSAEDDYNDDFSALVREALGPLGSDGDAVAVATSLVGPEGFYALKNRGYTSADAVRLNLELLLPWLERREAGLNAPDRG
jgi:hypothetical protein